MITLDSIQAKQTRNVQKVAEKTGVSMEAAYAMMMITATLMDLYPEDDAVVAIVLDGKKNVDSM